MQNDKGANVDLYALSGLLKTRAGVGLGTFDSTASAVVDLPTLVTAMADACADGSKYACLIPEERAFDPETLTEVLRAFGTSSHQVLIASPVWPSKVPPGWAVVECHR